MSVCLAKLARPALMVGCVMGGGAMDVQWNADLDHVIDSKASQREKGCKNRQNRDLRGAPYDNCEDDETGTKTSMLEKDEGAASEEARTATARKHEQLQEARKEREYHSLPSTYERMLGGTADLVDIIERRMKVVGKQGSSMLDYLVSNSKYARYLFLNLSSGPIRHLRPMDGAEDAAPPAGGDASQQPTDIQERPFSIDLGLAPEDGVPGCNEPLKDTLNFYGKTALVANSQTVTVRHKPEGGKESDTVTTDTKLSPACFMNLVLLSIVVPYDRNR